MYSNASFWENYFFEKSQRVLRSKLQLLVFYSLYGICGGFGEISRWFCVLIGMGIGYEGRKLRGSIWWV